jgi:hypothetical protein
MVALTCLDAWMKDHVSVDARAAAVIQRARQFQGFGKAATDELD